MLHLSFIFQIFQTFLAYGMQMLKFEEKTWFNSLNV